MKNIYSFFNKDNNDDKKPAEQIKPVAPVETDAEWEARMMAQWDETYGKQLDKIFDKVKENIKYRK